MNKQKFVAAMLRHEEKKQLRKQQAKQTERDVQAICKARSDRVNKVHYSYMK